MSVPDALYAITGQKAKTQYSVYSNTDNSVTSSNFKKTTLDPIQGMITVIISKKDHSVSGIKENYAYAMIPNPVKPSR